MALKYLQDFAKISRIQRNLCLNVTVTQQQVTTWRRWVADDRGTSPRKLVTNEPPPDDAKRLRPLRIYTRTGDKGTSSLFTGERRPKDDPIFEALGTIDELSCSIGLAREFLLDCDASEELCYQLQDVQCLLQDIQSIIATPLSSASERKLKTVQSNWTGEYLDTLEKWIDEHQERLPELKNFILPVCRKFFFHFC